MHATAEIDQAGRLIVPQEMRDALDLVPGTRILLEQEGNTIVLSPEGHRGELVESHGFLVWHSGAPQSNPIDVVRLIDHQREERMREVLGEGAEC